MSLKIERLSVLVVEDTAPMLKLVVSLLESLGVGKIYTADDGQRGFDVFKKMNPDIVISDWHMKTANGIDLALQIRKNPLSPNRLVPMILVTGYSAMNRVAEARDSGVTEFLIKPFSANDLALRLAHVINRPRDFIDCRNFFGPDRRRREAATYQGPRRRAMEA